MAATSSHDRRATRWLCTTGAACLVGSLLPLTTGLAQAAPLHPTSINNPPQPGREVVVFPSRDFVSAAGFLADETVTVEVHHSGLYKNADGSPIVVSTASGLVPQDDAATPEFDGMVEVNHAGAYGWGAVTPDIRPGDKVRVIVDNKLDAAGQPMYVAEETVTADVTTRRPVQTAPGTVVLRGVARTLVVDAQGQPVLDAAGLPTYTRIPIDQVEARLISAGGLFAANGRRALRAPGDGGTMAFDDATDPNNAAWTATFTGLSAADVTSALEAEARGMWLGQAPAAGTELTIFEIGAGVTGGPQGPGNGPLEELPPPPGSELVPPSTPSALDAAVTNSNTVTLTWSPASDNVGVTSYGVYRNGQPIANVQNADGAPNPATTYVDKNVPPGTYTYTVDAADEVGNRSGAAPGAAATTTAQSAVDVPVSEPPTGGIAMTVFPSRDFTEVEGIPAGQVADVQVIRNGTVISTADGVIPNDGAIEVNHPGGACWEGVTPEIRANDIVRVHLSDQTTGEPRSAHQLHVANVSASKAVQTRADDAATAAFEGEVQIHGFAQGHDGKPLPLGEIEARLISSSAEPFGKNGRRTLRAPEDGTLVYDSADNPLGTKFTATFSGLDAADVTKALEVEARVMWLGRDPLAGVELTIYEAGSGDPPGPATGFCSTPLEAPDETAPPVPVLAATADGPNRTVALTWTPGEGSTDVYGYRISRDGIPLANVGAAVLSYTDSDVGPGEHVYTVQAHDAASALGAGSDPITRLASGQGGEYGNFSSASAGRSVTMPDVSGPTAPGNLEVTNPTDTITNADGTTSEVGTPNARLVWDASTDDVAVVGYRVFRKDPATDSNPSPTFVTVAEGGVSASTATTTDPFVKNAQGRIVWTNTQLTSGATYTYSVEAYDAVPNTSPKTAEVPVVIGLDTLAPGSPANVQAVTPDPRGKDVVVTWEASTDTVDAGGTPGLVTAYRVYRNGVLTATVGGTSLTYTDTDIAAGTYSYQVEAVDSTDNRSDRTAQVAGQAVVANDPPAGGRGVIAFPARDFVEGSGYAPGEQVHVQVLRQIDGAWKTAGNATVAADAAGLVEVNHAGPGCWTTSTPDIRGGDIVRIIDSQGVADQTVTQALSVQRPVQTAPGTVVVKGTAQSALGLPIDAGRLEQRLVSTTTEFSNGRQSLLAPGNGTLVLDADGTFTATYTGLSAADVTRTLSSESIINYLGRDALLGNELTIMENGPGTDGGPADGVCTAPLEADRPLASWTPGNVAFGDVQFAPNLTTSAPEPVTLTNAGAAEMRVTDVYLAGANPGDYALSAVTLPATLAPGASLRVDVTFTPTATGARPATLAFGDDAANTSYQTVALTGRGVNTSVPAAPSAPRHTLLGQPTAAVQMSGGKLPARIDWNASSGTPQPDRYELEVSVAGGTYVKTATQPAPAVMGADGTITTAAATTAEVLVNPGQSHRYRVRACGADGCSADATAAAFTPAVFQNNNTNVKYNGTWTTVTLAGSFGGSVRHAAASGTRAELKTTGTGFQLISTKGPNRGRTDLFLNGSRVATIDLYAATEERSSVVFSRQNLANTTHTLQLRPLGNRNTSSTANRVDLDAFIMLR